MLFISLNITETRCVEITDVNTDNGTQKWRGKQENWTVTSSSPPALFFLIVASPYRAQHKHTFACQDSDVLTLQIGCYDFADSVLKSCLRRGKGEGIYMQIKFHPLMDLHSQHIPQHTIILRHSDHISKAFIFCPFKSMAIRIMPYCIWKQKFIGVLFTFIPGSLEIIPVPWHFGCKSAHQ